MLYFWGGYMSYKTINFEEFCSELSNNKRKFAFLTGNGLGLSHPDKDFRALFNFDIDEVNKHLKQNLTSDFLKDMKCPEEALGRFRDLFIMTIFNSYIDKQLPKRKYFSKASISLYKFAKQFQKLYTLNYDLLMYYAIMKGVVKSEPPKVYDGFHYDWMDNKKDFINKFSEYERRGYLGLLHIHGTYTHFTTPHNQEQKIKKINPSFIRDEYKTFQNQILQNTGEQIESIPLVVIAGRSDVKELIIKRNFYLQFCFEKLKQERYIFTFGCSFKKDEHILKAIMDTETHTNKEIYISYYNEDDKTFIENELGKYSTEHSIKLVNCGQEYAAIVGNKIWGKP